MKIRSVEIEDLKVIELDLWKDNRGYFTERFSLEKFKSYDLPHHFVQDNHSRSSPGVLRGLHFQMNPSQGKLVGVTRGRVWDVAIDLRPHSATFGKYFGLELSGDSGTLFWIPGGFAHGFCVLGDEPADMIYKVDSAYDPKKEAGILWSDPDLNIQWPIQNPILSKKDEDLPFFRNFSNHLDQTNKNLHGI